MADPNYSTLLIDLDCLLDTRLGTLLTYFSDQQVIKILTSNYFIRESDVFEGIDNDKYKELYANRGVEVLRHSIATPFLIFIKKYIAEVRRRGAQTPYDRIPKVCVNLYPYTLKHNEIQLIMQAIYIATYKDADITTINLSPKEITLAYLKDEIDTMIKYHYNQWMDESMLLEHIKKVRCPLTSLIAPAIYFAPITEENKMEDVNPFDYMEELIAPIIGLSLVPVARFCAMVKDNVI